MLIARGNEGGTAWGSRPVSPACVARRPERLSRRNGAMESYLDFFQKTMFALPWAQTDLNKKIQSYAGADSSSQRIIE